MMTQLNASCALALAARAGARRAPASAQTKWNLPSAYPDDNPHTRKPRRVRQGRRRGDRRQAADPRPCRRLAVQGAGDQARGRDRPGADRRGPDLDPGERRPDLRHRRRSVPGDELPRGAEALGGVASPRSRRSSPRRASWCCSRCRGGRRASTPRRTSTRRRHEGPEVARLQCRHRAHRRTGRRAGGDGAGGRTAAGAGTSVADSKRARGSFSRQRSIMRTRSAGKSGRTLTSDSGVSRRIAELSAPSVAPSNGRRPVLSSYKTTPSANTSVRGSTGSPRTCSGAIYGTVPMTWPGIDIPASVTSSPDSDPAALASVARPKSSTLMRLSVVSTTFAGFKSRWVMPCACAARQGLGQGGPPLDDLRRRTTARSDAGDRDSARRRAP